MKGRSGFLIVSLLLASVASAQTAQTSEPTQPPGNSSSDAREQEIRDMRARIERLENLVERLQREKETGGAGGAARNASTAPITETAAMAGHPSQPHDSTQVIMADEHAGAQVDTHNTMEHRYPALHLRGFGDVDFSATDEPGSKSGFNLGQFILHAASPLSQKVSVFGEISFTATTGVYNVDVERYLIRYDYNDHFKLSFGRYRGCLSHS